MRVNPRDGRCRACGGELEVIDADDSTMTVQCGACGQCYLVEPDALGDGNMTYFLGFHVRKEHPGDDP